MVKCFSAGFSYSVLMWPRFAVHSYLYCRPEITPYTECTKVCIISLPDQYCIRYHAVKQLWRTRRSTPYIPSPWLQHLRGMNLD